MHKGLDKNNRVIGEYMGTLIFGLRVELLENQFWSTRSSWGRGGAVVRYQIRISKSGILVAKRRTRCLKRRVLVFTRWIQLFKNGCSL